MEAEKLKTNNANYIRKLKDVEKQVTSNNITQDTGRKNALGNLGRVSVYSQFAKGMKIPGDEIPAREKHKETPQIDISYVDRETLEVF